MLLGRQLLRTASRGSRASVVPQALTRSIATAPPIEFAQRHVSKGLARLSEDVIERAEGSWVTFRGGRTVLDFTCGIGVTNLGHCHPKVSKAAAEQCLNLVHGQCGIAYHEPYLRLIERLLTIVPHASLDSFFFANSGSEAVEAALKMARGITRKQNIVAMQGAFHGRTFGAMAVTKSKTVYADGSSPLMPGVVTSPFPYWHHFNSAPGADDAELVRASLYQLELLLLQQSAPSDTAAVIVEPVLGEGGYVPAPPAFLQGLRDICDKNGLLLIIDEVQSGFGRTGRMFNIQYSGVRPDLLIMAKGLANGFPLSAVVSPKDLTDKLKPGTMVRLPSTPIEVADAFQEERILENVNARSAELFEALWALKADPTVGPHILDVRGQGLMVAVEFASPAHSQFDPAVQKKTPPSMSMRVSKRCLEKGLLLLTTSIYETVRFIPALNISPEDLGKGIGIFKEAVEEVIHEA
ncbi:pyridoxal phosphate-dependent transferase [Lactarius akahatsu]|uniref:Pyridoxal phosphate-dependent transferase n=1 Tax=Lactarius akahatsu TaxID=416441 RepID=A0AAD4QET3_9AGAM|nr:pyridoxal phosphate-dependent transferase [Lactarius akahatsu]